MSCWPPFDPNAVTQRKSRTCVTSNGERRTSENGKRRPEVSGEMSDLMRAHSRPCFY